jgi:hypothetical protein
MQNMPKCIKITVFAMEMLQLHGGNTSIVIHTRSNRRDMQYATVHCGLRDFAPPAHAGRGRRDVQNEEKLLDAEGANQSTITRLVARGAGIS